jgi:hypothetical protein
LAVRGGGRGGRSCGSARLAVVLAGAGAGAGSSENWYGRRGWRAVGAGAGAEASFWHMLWMASTLKVPRATLSLSVRIRRASCARARA